MAESNGPPPRERGHGNEDGLANLEGQLAEVYSSRSWRWTAPLRAVFRWAATTKALFASLGRRRAAANKVEPEEDGEARELRLLASGERTPIALPPAPRPEVSVVIAAHNHFRHTYQCLQALRAHTPAGRYEVIVVDDASEDVTRDLLPRVGGLLALRNETNQGFLRSCNAAAARARGEYLVFLHNDTVVAPGWLEELLGTFQAHPGAGLVGAKLLFPDGRLQEAGVIVFRDGSCWNYGRFGDSDRPEYNYLREVDYCSGACLMIPRPLFEALGGFDPRYAPTYYEDVDLAFRVREAGRKVLYQPLARVVHVEGLSSGTSLIAGVKSYQAVNHPKFHQRWAAALAGHGSPGDDPERHKERGVRRRVLVIDARSPTPDRDAGSLRLFHLLALLRDLSCHVAFLPQNLALLSPYTEALQRAGVEVLYSPYVGSVPEHLRQRGNEYDAVILSRADIADEFLDDVRRHAPRAVVLFDTVDLHYRREQREAELQGAAKLRRRAERRKLQELTLVGEADYTVVVTPTEQEVLKQEVPGAKVHVIPTIHPVHGSATRFADRRDLLFIGGFEHLPNVDAIAYFVGQIFPRVRDRLPGVKLYVVGGGAPPEVRALAGEDVVLTGHLPDVAPVFTSCRLSVAPLRFGAGAKGKINLSMSYGVPVVTTPVGAEGMHLSDGETALVAMGPEEFAGAVARLYQDEALWDRLSRNGLEQVRRWFSPEAVGQCLAALFVDAGLLPPPGSDTLS